LLSSLLSADREHVLRWLVVAEDQRDALVRFGPPIFAPSNSAWFVAGVEHSNGTPDGVVVMAHDIVLRTEDLSRPVEPISVAVANVQSATRVRGSRDTPHVLVEERQRQVPIAGSTTVVRSLESSNTFRFAVELDGRRLLVAGALQQLPALAIERVDDVASAPFTGT
jgi:hypothetical protein